MISHSPFHFIFFKKGIESIHKYMFIEKMLGFCVAELCKIYFCKKWTSVCIFALKKVVLPITYRETCIVAGVDTDHQQ